VKVSATTESGAGRDAEPLLLSLSGIHKRYLSVTANENISLQVARGEIHAILGENGAGKTTLMRIIYGVTQPDEGVIRWNGEPLRIESPAKARELGISMVFQHFSLFESVSVAENISLTVDGTLKELSARIREKGEEFGLPVRPDALVHDLSVGERQRVEIIRSLLQNPALLILDEPTSVLPPPNIERLFATLRRLSENGIAILFISHKLDEIRSLCHTATILRQGRVSGRIDPSRATADKLAVMMIGRDLPKAVHAPARGDGEVRLRMDRLSTANPDFRTVNLHEVSLEVRAGEILGVAGVSGNGQSTLVRLLSGEEALPRELAGRIELMGAPVGASGVGRRRELGLSYVPEERLGRGAAAPLSLSQNALLTAFRKGLIARGLIRFRRCDAFADRCIEEMQVSCTGNAASAASLSGGNLQKFIIGREMMVTPKVMIAAQPSWGIDVGAAAVVRQKLINLRDAGAAILLVSDDLDELFEVSDRLAVMFRGRLSEPLATRRTDAETVGRMMIGLFDHTDRDFTEAAQ
jgi:general nucleoside transport system ATP-binding protein